MRSTARALSVAVLASAALGLSAGIGAADPAVPPPPAEAGEPPAPPSADDPAAVSPPSAGQPAARVSPTDAAPGDTVTVSVSCGPTGGTAPASLDATSAAFEEGTVELRKVADDGGTASGPAYRGTARIATAEDFAAERSTGSTGSTGSTEDPTGTEGAADTEGSADTGLAGTEDWAETEGAAGTGEDWTVDGACPDASGGEGGDPWSATMSVPEESGAGAVPGATQPACRETAAPHAGTSAHGTPCAPTTKPTKPACPDAGAPHGESAAQGTSCGGATAEHGVRAGSGGTFGDSVPALVAGGVLIAGACGAAAHRLRLRLRGENRER